MIIANVKIAKSKKEGAPDGAPLQVSASLGVVYTDAL